MFVHLHVSSMKFLTAFPYMVLQVYTKSCYKNFIFAITFIDRADISLNTLPTTGLYKNTPSLTKIAIKLSEGGHRKNIWNVINSLRQG